MQKSLLAIFILSASATLYAQDATIYRWVDSNNVVHFSHEHPTDKDYAQIDVKVSYAPVKSAEQAEQSQQASDNLDLSMNENDSLSDSSETIKQNCEAAKANLKTLQDFEKVHIKDLEGNARLLSKEEKAEQITLSEKYVQVFCEGQDPNS